MKFSEIVDHLGKRGFAKRSPWSNLVIFFGMDNAFKCSSAETATYEKHCGHYSMSLADILADDWEIIDCFWGCNKADGEPWDTDNYMPWTKGFMKVVTQS